MTMLEKIAQAIDAGFDKGGLEGAARAAVEAMREPGTEIMRACHFTEIAGWQAAIDAILAEQPEKPE